MRSAAALLTLLILACPTTLLAQWQVGPLYPQQRNNPYDANPYSSYYYNPYRSPFRFNHFSGRFDYVPIPYDEERYAPAYVPPMAAYTPMYNPYTGQYMYGTAPPAPMRTYEYTVPPQGEPVQAGYRIAPQPPREGGIINYYYERHPTTQPRSSTTVPATQPQSPRQ